MPEQEGYKAVLKANNLKGALVSVREASEHLERAVAPALHKKCKELIADIKQHAFDELHREYPELWKGFSDEVVD